MIIDAFHDAVPLPSKHRHVFPSGALVPVKAPDNTWLSQEKGIAPRLLMVPNAHVPEVPVISKFTFAIAALVVVFKKNNEAISAKLSRPILYIFIGFS